MNFPDLKDTCDCGSSIVEAKGIRCTHNENSVRWLPTHYRNEELTSGFHQAGQNNTVWPKFGQQRINNTADFGASFTIS